MIRDLLNEWPINLQKSIMIGDQITDKKSAKSINLKFQYAQKDIFLQVKSFFN